MNYLKYYIILFLLLTTVSYGQTADEIVSKNLQARGGKSMFKDLKSMKFKATLNTMGSQIIMEVFVVYPEKLWVELKNPLGETVVSVFDGKKGWVIKGREAKPFPEGAYALLRAQIDAQIGFFYKNLYNYKKRKYSAELAGDDNTRNMPVTKLKITEPNGTEWLVYYEKNRFFDVRYDLIKDINGKTQNSSFHCKNFIPAGSFYFPSGADIYTNKAQSGSVTFSDIVINPKPVKSMFKLPKK